MVQIVVNDNSCSYCFINYYCLYNVDIVVVVYIIVIIWILHVHYA